MRSGKSLSIYFSISLILEGRRDGSTSKILPAAREEMGLDSWKFFLSIVNYIVASFPIFFLRHGGLYCGILVSFDWKKYPEFLFGIISILIFGIYRLESIRMISCFVIFFDIFEL